ncbi:ABC transporter permease subunit [Rhizomonospora bruguierae]|uniref:ABC transporter permease subunit n=1 Tax=Rhizomonospora bruguierae TaxID=1581705 RepID=UPI001BD073E9|nr:ABC transporter permease subunit [Micromonospora sp. NBRC 107566]
MSLYLAELRRLGKRRLTRFVLVLLILGLGAIVVAMTASSQKSGPAAKAKAEVAAEADYQEQMGYHRQFVARCEAAKEAGTSQQQGMPTDCAEITPPQREWFSVEHYLPFELDFRELFPIFIAVFAGILALAAYLVAASFVGAEWSSGGMTNLLLWRPKRLTVLLTKLGAVLTGVLATGLLLGALWTVAFWLIGRYDGTLGGMTPGVWRSFALDGARGLGLVLAVTTVGFGLASLGRHTAMALGAAVAVGVISEAGLRIATSVIGVPFPGRWILSSYALAWFNKKWTLIDVQSCAFDPVNGCVPKEFTITWQHSAIVFAAGTALVLLATLWTMRRRDVA